MITIRVSGLNLLRAKMLTAPRRIGKAISRAIKKSAFDLEAQAKKALTTGPTRAIDTGTLRSGTQVQSISDTKAEVWSLVDYAIYVHEGTYKMRARPYMNEAAKNSLSIIKDNFDHAIKIALR